MNFGRIALATLATGGLLTLAACGSSQPTSSGKSTPAPIKVGAIFDLTGPDAVFGTAFYQDAKIVFSQINANGGINGHKLEVYYKDDGSDAATAVQVAKQLESQDGVKIFFGGIFSPVALALDSVANQQHVFFMSPGSAEPALTTPVQPFVFAVNQTQDGSSRGIAKLVSSMKVRRVGMIEETDAYGQSALQTANTELGKYGLKVNDVATIAADGIDATSQILQLKKAGDQVILLGTTIDPATAVIKAEVQQGVTIPLVAYGGGAAPSIDQLLAQSPSVTYYAITPLACPMDPTPGSCVTSFLSTYQKAYPSGSPSVWTAEGYAATQVFVAGLKAAKSYTPQGIAQAVEGMPAYSNPLLPFSIKFSASSHLGVTNTFLYGFKNGKLAFFGNDVTQNQLH